MATPIQVISDVLRFTHASSSGQSEFLTTDVQYLSTPFCEQSLVTLSHVLVKHQ